LTPVGSAWNGELNFRIRNARFVSERLTQLSVG
jgi:hypothetical protein